MSNQPKYSKEEMQKAAKVFAWSIRMVNSENLTTLEHERAVEFLTYVLEELNVPFGLFSTMNMEFDKQIQDLEHLLYDDCMKHGGNDDSGNKILTGLGDANVIRRVVKDGTSVLKTAITSITNCRSFIQSMQGRLYTPRSEKYQAVGSIRTTPKEVDPAYLKHLKEEFDTIADKIHRNEITNQKKSNTRLAKPTSDDVMM